MTVLILTADSNPARNSQKSCLPTASEPAVSLFPTSVPVSEADEMPSGQPETATEADEALSGQPEAVSEAKVTRFSSFWKEEYPKGEVVGEYTHCDTLPTTPSLRATPPSRRRGAVILPLTISLASVVSQLLPT